MALVRAKTACFLGSAGYKTPADGEFEYNGPFHGSLEYSVTTADEQFEKFMKETSGGFHATDLDWTCVGEDADGFPVPKGSKEDVSGTKNPPPRKAGSKK